MLKLAVVARALHMVAVLIVQGNLPYYYKDGSLTIVCDKAESLKYNADMEG